MKNTLNEAEKAKLSVFFIKKARRKDRRGKSVKKILQKRRDYGILYMKLGADLDEAFRGLEDP